VRLVLHSDIPNDVSLGRQWNDLVHQMECPEVFYTYEWALAVHRTFGTDITPLLVLAYEGVSLVGVVALAADRQNKTMYFLTSKTADYCDFICSPGRRSEFVHAVLVELHKHQLGRLILANLPADSSTAVALSTARRFGYFAFARPGYLCAQVAIGLEDAREDTAQSVRRRLRRFRKAMGQSRQTWVTHARSPDEIEHAFSAFAKAHVARFLTTGRISNLAQAARRDFLLQLSQLLSLSESVVLSRLMLNERPIAWNFGFQFGGSWFWYQPTFDTEFRQYSPGVWLLSSIVEEACGNPGINRVDLGLGAEEYKERLANGSRQTLHITASSSFFAHIAGVVRYYAASAAKSIPQLEEFVRHLRRGAFSLHRALQDEGATWWFTRVWSYARARLFGGQQFLFLEWEDRSGSSAKGATLAANAEPISIHLLADAAMHYEGDSETLKYLVCAAKLVAAKAGGFALVNDVGIAQHFYWRTDFDASRIHELDCQLSSSKSDSALLCDCWTPVSMRKKDSQGPALFAIASHVRATGKRPWIAVPCWNAPYIREAVEVGFVSRFSATRKHVLLRNTVNASQSVKFAQPGLNISSAA